MGQGVFMDGEDRRAAEALATIQQHQDRTRRAADVPWWVYAATFVLTAGVMAANDFVSLSGAKLIAAVVLAALAVTFAVTFVTGSSLLGRVRGVEPRQSFNPRVFLAVAIVGGLSAALISRYGTGVANHVADSVGLGHYPNTASGVLYGAAFTGLFALGRVLTMASQRRANG